MINSEENEQKISIKKLVKNFSKMGTSIIRNSKPTFGFEHFGAKASVETDMNKSYKIINRKDPLFEVKMKSVSINT